MLNLILPLLAFSLVLRCESVIFPLAKVEKIHESDAEVNRLNAEYLANRSDGTQPQSSKNNNPSTDEDFATSSPQYIEFSDDDIKLRSQDESSTDLPSFDIKDMKKEVTATDVYRFILELRGQLDKIEKNINEIETSESEVLEKFITKMVDLKENMDKSDPDKSESHITPQSQDSEDDFRPSVDSKDDGLVADDKNTFSLAVAAIRNEDEPKFLADPAKDDDEPESTAALVKNETERESTTASSIEDEDELESTAATSVEDEGKHQSSVALIGDEDNSIPSIIPAVNRELKPPTVSSYDHKTQLEPTLDPNNDSHYIYNPKFPHGRPVDTPANSKGPQENTYHRQPEFFTTTEDRILETDGTKVSFSVNYNQKQHKVGLLDKDEPVFSIFPQSHVRPDTIYFLNYRPLPLPRQMFQDPFPTMKPIPPIVVPTTPPMKAPKFPWFDFRNFLFVKFPVIPKSPAIPKIPEISNIPDIPENPDIPVIPNYRILEIPDIEFQPRPYRFPWEFNDNLFVSKRFSNFKGPLLDQHF